MRAAAAIVMLLSSAEAAGAQSPLAAEVHALADRYHELFRTGLEVDGRFTGLRVGLARTLIKRGRISEARREVQAVLDEKTPSNPADWTLKDSPEARRLLDALPGRS